MPICKNCKDKFLVKYFNQKYCMNNDECIKAFYEKIKEQNIKKAAKEWRVKKSEIKEKLKTTRNYLKDLQVVFNRYIRLSKESICISCNKDLSNEKHDAGHYRSTGAAPQLRFEHLNVWPQCVKCNRDLHANLIEYRINLVKKIGVDKVDWLEKEHPPNKYTKEEIITLIKHYKQKIKQLN